MRVMVFVKSTADGEAGLPPIEERTEMFAAMGAFNEALVDAGIMVECGGLKPSSFGRRIAFDGERRTVINGPFASPNELVAGYWVWKVTDMDEAIAWAKRCPNPMPGPSELEIRPFYEAEDFGEALTPEMAAQEEHLRARLADKID